MKITLKKLQKMPDNDRMEFLKQLEFEFCEKCQSDKVVSQLLNCHCGEICKYYGIVKTPAQKLKTREKTCLEKYGTTNPAKSDLIKQKASNTWANKSEIEKREIQEKTKKTNLERYGSEKPFQSKESHEKYKQTMLKKYGIKHNWQNGEMRNNAFMNSLGVENPFQSEEVKETIKQTNVVRYGHKSPIQCDTIKQKIISTNNKRYGCDWGLSNRDIIQKSRETCMKKYGVPTANQYEPIRRKQVQNTAITNMERYGVPYYCMTDDCISKQGRIISKINLRFADVLKDNNIEFEQEFKIKNRSYDFKVGNILIEINPTYSHNSTYGGFFKNYQSEPKSRTYHLNKSLLAQENGFRCIHVWDWDDINKIISLLLPKQKLYARNCEIREVLKKERDEFLNLYHLQNTCRGQKLSYGLYYNDELIQIMTFGKPRYNKNYEWELLRLCTHKDYMLIGGSERLWKHFLRQQNPLNVISYCDFSKFSGEVYERLGLIRINKYLQPSTLWYNGKDLIRDTLLQQLGFDKIFNTNYGKGTNNYQLMKDNNFLEICDSGQITYAYN